MRTLALLVLLMPLAGATQPRLAGVPVRFADPAQAKSILAQRDAFVKAMSPFDRQARVRPAGGGAVSVEAYLTFASSQAIAWEADKRARVERALASLDAKLKQLALKGMPLPKEIVLVRTTGKEEGGAAYCRGQHAIVLPRGMLRSQTGIERLLTHELFHIVSRQREEVRRAMYRVIGFREIGPVPLPAKLASRLITNPDSPRVAYAITLGERVMVPVLFSSAAELPASAPSFFSVLQFRLMEVERAGAAGGWKPRLVDGEPVLVECSMPRKQPAAYFARIGGNTGYIIHPDEILAENFVALVQQTPRLPSPRIVRELKSALSKPLAAD